VAIYHFSAKILSRSTGRSAVAAAAYRSGARLQDERTGRAYDFTRKRGVEHAEILAPPHTPDWMFDRAELWNGVEKAEKRKDAQLAREIEVALPRELAAERRAVLVREFVQNEFVSQGMIADVAIHVGRAGDGAEQPHAHIMLTTRTLTTEGFGPKAREWNASEKLEGWRVRWAGHVNRELEREGHAERIDHRTLEAQRAAAERDAARARAAGDDHKAAAHMARADALDREPDPKMGPIASQMERLGTSSRRGDERREVEARNAQRQRLRNQAHQLAREIVATTRQIVDDARRSIQDLAHRLDTAYRSACARAEALARTTPAERTTDPADAAQEVAATMRDVLLGRTRPGAGNRIQPVDHDRLLGRARPNADQDAPDRDNDRER
jgi:ATP-dependent exoDNAse (exonuclease V) alpha subunit